MNWISTTILLCRMPTDQRINGKVNFTAFYGGTYFDLRRWINCFTDLIQSCSLHLSVSLSVFLIFEPFKTNFNPWLPIISEFIDANFFQSNFYWCKYPPQYEWKNLLNCWRVLITRPSTVYTSKCHIRLAKMEENGVTCNYIDILHSRICDVSLNFTCKHFLKVELCGCHRIVRLLGAYIFMWMEVTKRSKLDAI